MSSPKVVWQKDDARIVVWYEPAMVADIVVLVRNYAIEKAESKDALGEFNWRKIVVPNGLSEIVNDFLDKLEVVKEKPNE